MLAGPQIERLHHTDHIYINKFNPKNIGPNSYDVCLGTIRVLPLY